MGPETARFEEEFRKASGSRHAVAVSSGTAALHLALLALEAGPGDEVITTPFTFAATANAIELTGARTLFADIDPLSWNLSPAQAARKIGKRTKGILPVHFAGLPCDMKSFQALCRKRGLFLLDDAAHALGAATGGRSVGSLADATCFSFHPMKNITTGEGGMVTCSSPEIEKRLRLLRFHGLSIDTWKRHQQRALQHPEVIRPGYKYGLPDLLSALGRTQLARLKEFNSRRRELAKLYHRLLKGVEELTLPSAGGKGTLHAWHLYVALLSRAPRALNRDGLVQALRGGGVQSGVHYTALHLHSYYRKRYGYRRGDLPVAERVGGSCFSLPLYPRMKPSDVRKVCKVLTGILRHGL
jgi:dTDP-4-amino-4,6-dideoxygalactose transaminase